MAQFSFRSGVRTRRLPPDFSAGYQYPPWVKPIFREPLDEDSGGEYSSYSDGSESGGCLAINCHVKTVMTKSCRTTTVTECITISGN